jgi:mannose-6-phosphate isomerase-like protein (cupin superfamily)
MILNGQEVTESTVFSHQIKNVAYEYWELGPVAWEEDTIDKERFLITDLLEDIQSPVNKSEQIASAVALFVKLGNFYFRAKSKWCASNKSLIRYLELDNPELAATFIKSFDAVFQLGDAKQLIILVQKILAPYGGILWDGFRASASKLFRASGISYSEQKTKSIVVSKLHAPHYKWGQQCEGWWLKKDSKFTVISEIMPPGSWEIKHYHHVADQFFYVLEGYLSIFLNEQEYQLGRHQGISIPAKTIHQVLNKSEHEVKFLVISCPDSHGDREEIQST